MRAARIFLSSVTLAIAFVACGIASSTAQTAPALATPPAAVTEKNSAAATVAPRPPRDPKYDAAMAEAAKLVSERQYLFAADAYKKANKTAGGKDRESLTKLFDLQLKIGEFKDAISTASALEGAASTAREKSVAETSRGRVILAELGDKNKVDKLQAADAAFKAAIADYERNATAHFLDGQVLARLHRMDSAGEQFKACLTCISPNDPMYTRAQHFAEDPELSTAKMAPAFTVTALDGTKFNLDEMGGRVVLIDFWATWCGPCNAELPHMKKIAREFAGQPLVIISVSWDSDETKWKNFIDKNEMTWVQYRDADHALSTRYGINSIPHYFTIDADGVLTSEMLGSGSDVEGKLKKLVAKAKLSQKSQLDAIGTN